MTVCWTPPPDAADRALARLPWPMRASITVFALLGLTQSRTEQRIRARLQGR